MSCLSMSSHHTTHVGSVVRDPWTFLNMSLRARIMPICEFNTSINTNAYQEKKLCSTKEPVTLYLNQKICGFFDNDPKMFLKCCENINIDKDTFSTDSILVIDLYITRVPIEMIMPAYAVILLNNHAYCFLATKLIIKSMKTPHLINQLLNHLQAYEEHSENYE